MNAHSFLNVPRALDFETGNLNKKWKTWKEEFLIFLAATETDSKSGKVKVQMLLNLIGARGRDVFKTFTWNVAADKNKFDKVLEAFDNYVCPKKNVTMVRFSFFNHNQGESQSIEDYIIHQRYPVKRS